MATVQIEATLKQGVVINLYARYFLPRLCALIVRLNLHNQQGKTVWTTVRNTCLICRAIY